MDWWRPLLGYLIYNYSGTENVLCRLSFPEILRVHVKTVGLLQQQGRVGFIQTRHQRRL